MGLEMDPKGFAELLLDNKYVKNSQLMILHANDGILDQLSDPKFGSMLKRNRGEKLKITWADLVWAKAEYDV